MRWLYSMAVSLLISGIASASSGEQLAAARAIWQATKASTYSFVYESRDDNIVPRQCFPYAVRSYVNRGKPAALMVVRGEGTCPPGATLPEADREKMPRTVESLFAKVEQLLSLPPTVARVEVSYDPKNGVPIHVKAEKIDIADNDEGFEVTDIRIKQ